MQDQLITSHTKGHHLTLLERVEIAALHARGESNRQIATLPRHQSPNHRQRALSRSDRPG
jgi:IS30 family transposase